MSENSEDDRKKFLSAQKKSINERQKERNTELNHALSDLEKQIPCVEACQKIHMTRKRTINLATEFIKHLMRIINGEQINTGTEVRPLNIEDFRVTVAQILRSSPWRRTAPDIQPASEDSVPNTFAMSNIPVVSNQIPTIPVCFTWLTPQQLFDSSSSLETHFGFAQLFEAWKQLGQQQDLSSSSDSPNQSSSSSE